MIEISKIEWSNRKSLAVSISGNGEIVVKAPVGCPMTIIEKFLDDKKSWIESKLAKFSDKHEKFADIINYKKLLILGNSYYGYSSEKFKKIKLEEDRILIPKTITPDKLHKKITKWYHSYADDFLLPRTTKIADMIGLKPTSIKCTGSRGRWGACNSNGELFLNWRCIMLPPELIDYVIVHELSHLLELNHSPKFWAVVEKVLPDYKLRRKRLKEYDFCLRLF